MKFDKAEASRLLKGEFGTSPGDPCGVFVVLGPCGRALTVIADDGSRAAHRLRNPDVHGWEHASVSFEGGESLPNWTEMDFVKRLFWDDEEAVMQLHPPRSQWVSNAEVLHLWRPIDADIPLPPTRMVGKVERS